MATIATQKNAAYDNAVYLSRMLLPAPVSAAGAAGTMGRWIVPTAMTVNGVAATQVVAGTSTYTATITQGTAVSTATITAATALNAYRVSGTTTTTYANFAYCSVAAANPSNYYSLAVGGVNCLAGDILYILNGTDATATTIPMWDVSFTPTGNVAA